MPTLSELEECLRALRAYYAGRAAWPAAVSGGRFSRALSVLAGPDKARPVLRVLSEMARASAALSPASLLTLSREQLELALRPSGLAPAKAGRVCNFLDFLSGKAKDGDLDDPNMSFLDSEDTGSLRAELLQVRGLGLGSVDSVLLLALERPVFAVNAQIWRLLRRHGFVGEEAEYAEMQQMFTAVLPEDAALYRECHFMLRRLTGEFCRAGSPSCAACPLAAYLEYEPCE